MNVFSRNSLIALMSMMAMGSSAVASAESTITESGVCTGIFNTFYFGERDIDHIPVSYERYDDGSIVLKEFANGHDLKLLVGDELEYSRFFVDIEDIEGVGVHDVFTYEGYEYWPFDIYRFLEPAVISVDQVEFIFVDGSSNYNQNLDKLTLDYTSALDGEEYMFDIDFSAPFSSSAISEIQTTTVPTQTYDLSGRRADSHQKGLHIVNGKVQFGPMGN